MMSQNDGEACQGEMPGVNLGEQISARMTAMTEMMGVIVTLKVNLEGTEHCVTHQWGCGCVWCENHQTHRVATITAELHFPNLRSPVLADWATSGADDLMRDVEDIFTTISPVERTCLNRDAEKRAVWTTEFADATRNLHSVSLRLAAVSDISMRETISKNGVDIGYVVTDYNII